MRIEAPLTTGDRFIQKDEPRSLHPQGPLGRARTQAETYPCSLKLLSKSYCDMLRSQRSTHCNP